MGETKLKNINTVIFDLDGTLLDTLEDLKDALNYALSKHGMPERSLDEVRCFVGNGAKELLKKAVPEGEGNPEFVSALADFKGYYQEHSLIKTAPYEGVVDVMRQLKARGYKLAIVSNKPDAAVKDLDKHFFRGLTEVAIGESERIAKKPAPDMVNEAVAVLSQRGDSNGAKCENEGDDPVMNEAGCADAGDVASETGCEDAKAATSEAGCEDAKVAASINAVYVGDSEVDLATAKNSNLPCISVTWGFRDRDFLIEKGATLFADRPVELLEIIG